jgi:hypothetical protein
MGLFDSLVNYESFRTKPIILFMNKDDMFLDKLVAPQFPTTSLVILVSVPT